MTEKPYAPFYKPYGMTDEEYEYEVKIAEQRLAEWENDNEPEARWAECGMCGEMVLKILDDKYYEENGCFCSPECEYELRTGNLGEEY